MAVRKFEHFPGRGTWEEQFAAGGLTIEEVNELLAWVSAKNIGTDYFLHQVTVTVGGAGTHGWNATVCFPIDLFEPPIAAEDEFRRDWVDPNA